MTSERLVKRGRSKPPRSPTQRTRAILQQAVAEVDGLPAGYGELLEDLKSRIRSAQTKAALAANRGLILLYWDIGRRILDRQGKEGWGAKVIDRLSRDLCREFPTMHGFSGRNLKYMRAFAEAYRSRTIVQQLAAQIPWFHHCLLMEKVKDPAARVWYIKQTIANGWSRNVLALQIDSGLYLRQGRGVTNFPRTLPPPQSDLAQQVLKDPYVFDFLSVGPEAHERAVENALVSHITRFLLELGTGFSFVGQQYHLEVENQDFYVDLLFYHTRLHCYVAVELKAGEFKPEYAGQINFYLSALDDLVRTPGDNPSIGIVLCATKSKVVAEYALRDMTKPIGVSEYKLTRAIPADLKTSLPTIEELEAELSGGTKTTKGR
jgi:predicted nuclease of restriction endonuclease-like (RecB) superfamily